MRRMGWLPAPRCRAPRGSIPLSSPPRRWLDVRGAAVVELALILPIATSLVLGVTSGGMAYNRKLSVTDAVREGSRLGATLLPASVTPPDTWLSTVRGRTVDLSGGQLSSSAVCVKLVREAGTTDVDVLTSSCPASMTADEPATPANLSTGGCIVKVWAQRSDRLLTGFFSTNLTLTARAVSRYEGASSC